MASISLSGFIRAFLAFSLMGAGLVVGWLGVLVLVEVIIGPRSHGGNAFLVGLGATLFVFSPVILIAGIIYWRSADYPDTQDDS
jgi:hypothetical protein